MTLGLAACDPPGPAAGPTVTDDAGRAVALAPLPRRVVSLVPSATEWLTALGVADRLVARTDFDTDPALRHLPSLGRTLWPDPERIHALEPDLVLTPPDALSGGLARRLDDLGLRVYEVDAQRLRDALATLERVATLVGREERGRALARGTALALDSLRASVRGAPRPSLVYLVWHDPPLVAGAGTYVDDLVEVAGGRNAFGDVAGWAQVSLEEVVRRNPDFVIVPRGEGHSLQPEWLDDAVGWRALPALRAGRVIVVDSDLFNRPGPRVVEAAEALARGLHPQTLVLKAEP